VKEPGHADSYEGLVIDFKPGKKPHLIIEDEAGEELERIDLAPISTDEIHELVQSKGFCAGSRTRAPRKSSRRKRKPWPTPRRRSSVCV